MTALLENRIRETRYAKLASVPGEGLRNQLLSAGPNSFTLKKRRPTPKGGPERGQDAGKKLYQATRELKRLMLGSEEMSNLMKRENLEVDIFEGKLESVLKESDFPEFLVYTTVIDEDAPEHFLERMEPLLRKMEEPGNQSYLVIVFAEPSPLSFVLTSELFLERPLLKARVEISHRLDNLENELGEAFAKAIADWQAEPVSLLDHASKHLRGVVDLYSDGKPGRLCARKVAKAFGLTQTKLADILTKVLGTNISLSRLNTTPYGETLQPGLLHFEEIARLRNVMGEQEFKAWLNQKNWSLEEETPYDCILQGHVDVVANLASNMLLGNPS